MVSKTLLAASALSMFLILTIRRRRRQRRKSTWCRSWLQRRCNQKGVLNMLNDELLLEDPCSYTNFLRLTSDQFQYLLNLIEKDIAKSDTVMREAISARNRLEVTLRFLATGETFRSLMYATRIHESTISRFVPEVCDAITLHLQDQLKIPQTAEEWKDVANNFFEQWQFPNCLGAIDGRHINFRAPASVGSYYFNYKGHNSIVLLGLVDANYKFLYVNIGVNGRVSDGGVYRESALSHAVERNLLNFPPNQSLPGRTKKSPYVIVGDSAFSLSTNLMKPYPQRGLTHKQKIFNYRLSRARRVVENAFGILANRFRILLTTINLSSDKVEKIVLTCVVLHNFLARNTCGSYIDLQQDLPNSLNPIGRQGGNVSTINARVIREEFTEYFSSPFGSIPWQEDSIQKNNL